MFGFFKRKAAPRELNHPQDLIPGDLISFKPRSILPPELQGQTATVKQVCGYQYSEGLTPEYTLTLGDGQQVTFMLEPEEDAITLSKEIPRTVVEQVFDMTQFAELFGDNFVTLNVNANNADDTLKPWLASQYAQAIKHGIGYFYNSDQRAKPANPNTDNSEELRFHECTGSPDDFSLNIEIWEDGTTQVFVQKTVPFNVIEEMWPNG